MGKHLNYLIAGSFIALIFLTIIFVTAVLPATTFQPEATEAAFKYDKTLEEGYTEEEVAYGQAAKRGRNIYRREGCFYCHTQFNRYQDRESGVMVKAGDYVYETPHVLGTERTGPDLSNIGGRYPDAWHVAHHIAPRKMKPGSIMPSYSYLTDHEMADLVVYLQSVGANREEVRAKEHYEETGEHHEKTWFDAPQEIKDDWERIAESKDVNNSAYANAGRGIYMQNCAQCHGVAGKGNGPVSKTMLKKPANLTRPYYSAYSDAMYYWRLKEGVAGSRMPRWGRSLSEEQLAYLVAFVKTLPVSGDTPSGEVEVTRLDQLDNEHAMDQNYREIEMLGVASEENPYVYGGGRH